MVRIYYFLFGKSIIKFDKLTKSTIEFDQKYFVGCDGFMEIEYIKSLKKAKNITVKQLSDLTNLSENTINNVLSRKTENPSFEVVSKLILALGGSLDALAGAERKEKEGEDVTAFIATLTDMYEKQIERLQKDKFYLFSLLAIVLVIVFVVLAIDVVDGNVGWIRH